MFNKIVESKEYDNDIIPLHRKKFLIHKLLTQEEKDFDKLLENCQYTEVNEKRAEMIQPSKFFRIFPKVI